MALRIAVVSPRYADGATVGGAESLLREHARRLAGAGHDVHFLATCARDHVTWENELPAGTSREGPLTIRRFPVDEDRDPALFLRLQTEFCRGRALTAAEEETWLKNGVNSRALMEHLRAPDQRYDRILAGPYLFPLVIRVGREFPDRTLLVPCLHDEPFARLGAVGHLFGSVRDCLFNSEPERALAQRLFRFDPDRGPIVGMGLDPFDADPSAFARRNGWTEPYAFYCGRREAGKGTPLLIAYLDTFRRRTGRDLRLVLAGSGSFEHRPFIRDAGFLSEPEKREAMAGAAVFIHPSVFESLGIVLLESFLAGTPALVHAQGEVLRWQCERSGAGLWFRHYPDFEESLERLLGDDTLRRRMGAQGRRFVQSEYAWPAVERRLLSAVCADPLGVGGGQA